MSKSIGIRSARQCQEGKQLVAPIHLGRAPISEAIIDVKVRLPGDFDCAGFEAARAELRDVYPVLKKRESVFRKFELSKSGEVSHGVDGRKLDGYFFLTEDERTICQFRDDGFTFNKLTPYSSWDILFPTAKRAWEIYRRIANPVSIARIAVRYINKFDVPVPIRDFAEIFTAPPRVSEALPQEFLDFHTRVVIVDPPRRAATIVQSLEVSAKTGHLTLVLDIDAFATTDIADGNFDEMFEQLHSFKNDIFFNSLTPATLESFK